mgnify:CR=1 FL=1
MQYGFNILVYYQDFYFIEFMNHMNDTQKKWLVHRCLQLSKNKKILKQLQDHIEGWVNENETRK